jgi:hypothetical protein
MGPRVVLNGASRREKDGEEKGRSCGTGRLRFTSCKRSSSGRKSVKSTGRKPLVNVPFQERMRRGMTIQKIRTNDQNRLIERVAEYEISLTIEIIIETRII